MNILEKIVEYKKQEVLAIPQINAGNLKPSVKDFLSSLRNNLKPFPKLIAEIKPRSPSSGEIFPQVDVLKLAKIYENNGATAISVLTDERFFGGSFLTLKMVAENVQIPVLCKDFIIDEKQILLACQKGASAVLLMTQILSEKEIFHFLQLCEYLNITGLVEIFDEKNLETALRCNAKAILVNSRNFFDPLLKIDLNNFHKILPLIPNNLVKIAASGLSNYVEVEKISHLCDAILVGTNFMQLQDYDKIADEICVFSNNFRIK